MQWSENELPSIDTCVCHTAYCFLWRKNYQAPANITDDNNPHEYLQQGETYSQSLALSSCTINGIPAPQGSCEAEDGLILWAALIRIRKV